MKHIHYKGSNFTKPNIIIMLSEKYKDQCSQLNVIYFFRDLLNHDNLIPENSDVSEKIGLRPIATTYNSMSIPCNILQNVIDLSNNDNTHENRDYTGRSCYALESKALISTDYGFLELFSNNSLNSSTFFSNRLFSEEGDDADYICFFCGKSADGFNLKDPVDVDYGCKIIKPQIINNALQHSCRISLLSNKSFEVICKYSPEDALRKLLTYNNTEFSNKFRYEYPYTSLYLTIDNRLLASCFGSKLKQICRLLEILC